MTGPIGVPAKGLVARTEEQRPGQGMSEIKLPMEDNLVRENIKTLTIAHAPSVVSQI